MCTEQKAIFSIDNNHKPIMLCLPEEIKEIVITLNESTYIAKTLEFIQRGQYPFLIKIQPKIYKRNHMNYIEFNKKSH